MLSEAVETTETLFETVALFRGDVMETVGGVVSAAKAEVNVAVTVVLLETMIEQVPTPEQPPPDQPVKVEPESGFTVKATDVPEFTAELVQAEPQLIPPTDEVTVPLPVPDFTALR